MCHSTTRRTRASDRRRGAEVGLRRSAPHHDLGRLWLERTGLPMVFAVWAAPERTPPELSELENALVASLRRARAEPEPLAHESSSATATRPVPRPLLREAALPLRPARAGRSAHIPRAGAGGGRARPRVPELPLRHRGPRIRLITSRTSSDERCRTSLTVGYSLRKWWIAERGHDPIAKRPSDQVQRVSRVVGGRRPRSAQTAVCGQAESRRRTSLLRDLETRRQRYRRTMSAAPQLR